jgi:pimeloyl-ACP methyl ester carboxylesterase
MSTLINYETEGSGSETLVLLHGLGMSSRVFDLIRPHLSPHYRLLIPDRRGIGLNRQLAPTRHMQDHMQDLVRILDHENIDQTHVMGVSMGGTLAQQFARSHPDRLRKLVLTVTFPALATYKRLALQQTKILGPLGLYYWLPKIGLKRLDVGKKGDDLYTKIQALMQETPPSMLRADAECIGHFDSRPWLPTIQHPTLILGGAHDRIVPIRHSLELVRLLPNARLEILPCGHALIGTHAQASAQRIVEFLQKP